MQFTNSDVTKKIQHMAEHGRVIAQCFEKPGEIDVSRLLPGDVTNPMLEAIHLVEHHQSDLLIGIRAIVRDILEHDHACYVFGLRQSGVDHNCYLDNRFSEWYRWNNYVAMTEYYRRIFILEYHKIPKDETDPDKKFHVNELHIVLKDATRCHPYKDPDAEENA